MLKTVLKYILTFSITMIILIGLLFFSSLIPSKYLQENVKKSSEFLNEFGEKQQIKTVGKEETLFLFTDAIMLNIAYSVDNAHPYEAMMFARKNYIPGQTQNMHEEVPVNIGTSPNYVDDHGNTFQVAELYGLMHDENIIDSYEYTRYWHGYLIFLRPLLTVLSIEGIRNLLFAITVILTITILFLIIKKLNFITAIIYLVTFLSVDLYVICNAMNEIATFIIALIAIIFILLKNGKFKNPGAVFLVVGMCTSFFDLLTTPLVTLGLTLPLYVLLNIKEDNKKLCLDCIKICIAWGVGYGLCWALKWIITDITLNRHIISDAIKQVFVRTGNIIGVDYLNVLQINFKYLSKMIIKIFIGIIAFFSIIGVARELYIKKCKKEQNEKIQILKILIFAIIALMPFGWFFILQNHSYIHAFFTYGILGITILNLQIVFTLFMGLQDNLLKKDIQIDKN